MTLETMAVLAIKIRSSYTFNVFPDVDSVKVWSSLLKDFSDKDVSQAVDAWLKTEEKPPTPASIIRMIQTIKSEGRDWSKAWELAISAVRNYGSYLQSEGMKWLKEKDAVAAETVGRIGYDTLCRMTEYSEVNLRQSFKAIYESIEKEQKFSNATGLIGYKPRLIQ